MSLDILVDVRIHLRKAEGVISSKVRALVREPGLGEGEVSPFGVQGSPAPATVSFPDTQSTTGFHLYSQSLPKKSGRERLGATTTRDKLSVHDPRVRSREGTHSVARASLWSAKTIRRGFSRGSTVRPLLFTVSKLIRETSAPESIKASMTPPFVIKRYTSERGIDEDG